MRLWAGTGWVSALLAPNPVNRLYIQLLYAFDRYKTHPGTLRSLVDRLCIHRIILVGFDERLDKLGSDQLDLVAIGLKQTPPVVSTSTALHDHQTRRQLYHEHPELVTSQLLTHNFMEHMQ